MLNEQDVLQVASLSRLDLNKEEIEKFKNQLSSVLDLFGKIQDIDTDDVEETSQVTGLKNITRDDEIIKSDSSREELLQNAPQKTEQSIIVPKVLEDK